MGKMMKPIIDSFQKNMMENSHPMFGQAGFGQGGGNQNFGGNNNNFGGGFGNQGGNNNNFGGLDINQLAQQFGQNFNNQNLGGFGGQNNFGNNNNNNTTNNNQGPAVEIVNDLGRFQNITQNSEAVIVDFFSYSCGPCMNIKPVYEKIAKDYKQKCPQIKFISVDTQKAPLIAGQFGIKAIPTFVSFYKG